MKKYIFLLSMLCAVLVSKGSLALEEQLKSLPEGGLLQAEIRQSRYLQGLSEPIVSEGTLKFVKGEGLIWAIKKPFPSTIILTPNGLFQIENGQKREQKALQQKELFSTLSSVFSGNFKESSAFDVGSTLRDKKGWSVSLRPKPAAMKSLFQSIKISGNVFINQIEINRTNQDKDIISLSRQVITAPPLKESSLSKQEKKWLQDD